MGARARRTVVMAIACGMGVGLPAGSLGGCSTDPTRGYAPAGAYDASVRTVSVSNFENQTFSRGLELRLTDAIVKRIQRRTPYRVVPAERADTALSGAITGVDLRRLSDDPQTGLAQEESYQITIRFAWVDNRTGEARVVRENFSAAGVFAPARGAGERIEVGQRDAIDELAQAVVESMRSGW